MSALARRLLPVLVVVGLLAAAPSVHAQTGSIGIRLLDAPTNRSDDPRARVYIVDHVAPGTTITRRVEVNNDTDDAQSIDLYAAAASVRGGEFRFGDGRARNELTTWTSVDPRDARVEPGDKQVATVTIAVPADASPGERYAVVWASVSAAAPDGGGIAAVNRVGVRIYLSVGPGGEPASDFEVSDLRAGRENGVPVVTARVQNTGGRALDVSGELRLSEGPAGLRAGPFPVTLGTTLGVGESDRVTVELDKQIPPGPWRATMTLKSGITERSASARLTFDATSPPVAETDEPAATPWVPIVGGAAAAAGGAALVFQRRRRQTV